MDSSSADRAAPPPEPAHQEPLEQLQWATLRTMARARHRARVRVAESVPAAHPGHHARRQIGEPFTYDGAETAPPSDVAVLPGLPSWLPAVLGVLRGSSTVLRPEYGADGTAEDFTVVGANHFELSGVQRGSYDFLGKLLSETRPGVRASGMYDVYRAALEARGPVSSDTIDYVDVVHGVLQRARLRGTVTLLPDEHLLLTNWEPVGEARLSRRIQQRGRMGWAEWDLVTGRVRWSQGMRDLLGLQAPLPEGVEDPKDVAPTIASAREVEADVRTVAGLLDPADLPGFVRDMRILLAGGQLPDREATVVVGGERRLLRWVAHAQPEDADVPESLLFAARNVTDQEAQLSRALGDAERARQEAETERRFSETFRKALVPPLGRLSPRWIDVSAAYVPSESGVGGDWYKCRERPDGRVLLAVGDASGHGVSAASRALQQRSALAGLAYTDEDAAQLATALGEVVYHDYYGSLDTTATCVVGHLHPDARVFRWASAGHPPPILVRDGEPHLLETAYGLMLGVLPDAPYEINDTQLRAGDLLLMYTDGVVERRGRDLDAGTDLLLDAVRGCVRHSGSGPEVMDCVVHHVLGPEAEDDATILAVHVF
ncbi:PP2C family protein-serine/threonine phosphatase [Streptomyces albus]|uniref:PP2C family protein-serine/threonine phosphatase n=1 Tax=Streptomyces albus TaxID=1888 RepID=UPI003F1E1FD2